MADIDTALKLDLRRVEMERRITIYAEQARSKDIMKKWSHILKLPEHKFEGLSYYGDYKDTLSQDFI